MLPRLCRPQLDSDSDSDSSGDNEHRATTTTAPSPPYSQFEQLLCDGPRPLAEYAHERFPLVSRLMAPRELDWNTLAALCTCDAAMRAAERVEEFATTWIPPDEKNPRWAPMRVHGQHIHMLIRFKRLHGEILRRGPPLSVPVPLTRPFEEWVHWLCALDAACTREQALLDVAMQRLRARSSSSSSLSVSCSSSSPSSSSAAKRARSDAEQSPAVPLVSHADAAAPPRQNEDDASAAKRRTAEPSQQSEQ